MAKELPPIPLAPERTGVSKRASKLTLSDRWVDSDKVLFIEGKPEKMLGWEKLTVTSVDAPIRGILSWTTTLLSQFMVFGTHLKLYVIDTENDPIDITPIEETGTLTDPFTTEIGSATVNVEHTDHGRSVGDQVFFENATAVGGITIDGWYTVATVVDQNNYTIVHSGTASSTAGPGGGTVDYEYELATGTASPVEGDGWGAGGYGLYEYGEPTEDAGVSIIFEPRAWSLVRAGDLVYANPVNSGIFVFDPNDTPSYQRAEPLTGAPTVCRALFMTAERFPFALGVDNDPMNIKWPDQDDHTDWTPTASNTANSRRLQEGTRLIGGISLGNRISGIWSDTSLYRFQYTGSSFVYDSQFVARNCGLVSPMAVVSHMGIAYWMSKHGFHMWGGGAPQYIQGSEDINEFVVLALRQNGYEYKCNAYFSQRFNCIFWFYVAAGTEEPGLYVVVSLDDFSWAVGELERTSGGLGFDQRPVLGAADGYLYQHEEGNDADGEIMEAFIERAPMRIAQGSVLGEIQMIETDMQRQTGDVTIEIDMRDRIKEDPIDSETLTLADDEDIVEPSIGGRIASIIIRSAELGGDFRIGTPLMTVVATGKQR